MRNRWLRLPVVYHQNKSWKECSDIVEAANINDFQFANIRCEMIVGYARVSTDGLTLDAQHAALREAGCAKVFAEKVSGAKTDRAQLARALATLAPGDTLVVCAS
jgi:hypothetical protein